MSAAQDEFNELIRDKSQRTRHPEDDDDDAQSFLNLSEDEDDDRQDYSNPPSPGLDTATPRASTSIPTRRYAANTGPKGVISDAQNFRDSRASARSSMASTRGPAAARSSSSRPVPPENGIEEEDDELDDLDEEDGPDDKGFMARWRQSRIRDMQSGSRESKMHLNGRSKNAYGGIATVDGEGYLDAVDNSGSDTVVVVYIYDEYVSFLSGTVSVMRDLTSRQSQVSDLFETCLRSLAGKHRDTRFVKLHYDDAEMEPAGVPAIIAYRGGEKFAGLVPLVDEMPDDADLNATTLETVMKRFVIC